MDLQVVYAKTEKGLEELATRAFKLPSRVRNLLVLVDGTHTGEHIVETTAVLGDSAAFFSMLVEEGFIAPVGGAAEKTGAASQPPRQELVHAVCHLVTDILGPVGDSLTLRLEKARTFEEFAKLVEQCRGVIENAAGKKKGDQFWETVTVQLAA